MNLPRVPGFLALWIYVIAGCSQAPRLATVSKPLSPDEQTAEAHVTSLVALDVGALDGPEDAQMRRGMTKDRVASAVGQITKAKGAFAGEGAMRTGKFRGLSVIYIPCTFSHGALDAKVIFDRANKVAGFHFIVHGGS
ncbi:MAG: DUF3887 domain-containing protein [Fimbriimonadaceae bacterium]